MIDVSCGTASSTVASDGRFSTTPTAPSSECAVTSTTVRWKFGSSNAGDAISRCPWSDSIRRIFRDESVSTLEFVGEASPVRTDAELDAEAQARRRLALAQIRQYPDPVLRMQARDVAEFDDDLLRLAERMKALMSDAQGVGLAANQVGVLRRVFVYRPRDDEEARVLVNARIVERSGAQTDDEGCLSMQGIVVPVERELDNLDGVLILDRTTREARREALAALRPRTALG